jgi:hypothetical protein
MADLIENFVNYWPILESFMNSDDETPNWNNAATSAVL